jgi:hypothetical protein
MVLTITTVDSHNLLVAGNLSQTLRSRSLVQPRGLPLLLRFSVRGLLRPLSASSTDPSQRACLTSYEPKLRFVTNLLRSLCRNRARDVRFNGSKRSSPSINTITFHFLRSRNRVTRMLFRLLDAHGHDNQTSKAFDVCSSCMQTCDHAEFSATSSIPSPYSLRFQLIMVARLNAAITLVNVSNR